MVFVPFTNAAAYSGDSRVVADFLRINDDLTITPFAINYESMSLEQVPCERMANASKEWGEEQARRWQRVFAQSSRETFDREYRSGGKSQ